MSDVLIIGCGVIGANIAYELSKLNISVTVLEKENDVSMGTSKANSSIVHAGYDPIPNTLMAKLNVLGSKAMESLCRDLDVEYKRIGSLVLAFDEKDEKEIQKLYKQGLENGVEELSIIENKKILEIEPNISKNVKSALLAKTAAVISPWGLTIALSEVSRKNGVEIKLNTEVLEISKENDEYTVKTNNGDYKAKYIINSAGVDALNIYGMYFEKKYSNKLTKGEYYLLDKGQGELTNRVIFQCPNEFGKGVLVSKTVHGNLIVGPSSEEAFSSSDVNTTKDGLEKVLSAAVKSIPNINFRENIRNFAGVRSIIDAEDFIIERTEEKFINLLGIKSPGLSASPAIANMVSDMFKADGYSEKENFVSTRKQIHFERLSLEEKNELIKKDSRYGRIICRCESVTEGEIIDAIKNGATTIDGIKRRALSGMGRCQGGFCAPKILEILAREKNIPVTDILLDKNGTFIITSETKIGDA